MILTEKRKLPLIIAVCSEPGSAKAVAPVIELLRKEGKTKVLALAFRQASQVWKSRNLEYHSPAHSTSLQDTIAFLEKESPVLVLTGTSGLDVEQKRFIAAARHLNIPSLAVLDFWTYYIERFSDGEGKLSYLPDRIAVVDERMKNDLISSGFEQSIITITGNPAHDDLYKWKTGFTADNVLQLRKKLGINPDDLMVLFASQPLSDLFGTDTSNPMYPGYSEKTVFPALAHCLSEIQKHEHKKIILVIRPHPRENPDYFLNVNTGLLPVSIQNEGDSRDLVMAADIVVGMTTMLLVEACYLGKVVASLQPGLLGSDPLPTNQTGLSLGIYTYEDISPKLTQLLQETATRDIQDGKLEKGKLDDDAAGRVARCIYRLIGLQSESEYAIGVEP